MKLLDLIEFITSLGVWLQTHYQSVFVNETGKVPRSIEWAALSSQSDPR